MMYCRNCGNEVHEKAVACPKCGVNPRSEKKFCYSCGTETNSNQIICTTCGVSLATQGFSFDASNLQKNLQKFDFDAFVKNKASMLALVAFIGCFLPWLKLNMYVTSESISGLELSKIEDYPSNTIIVPFLLNLFPICLLAYILSDFVSQISKYKRYFLIGSIVLIIYAGIGLYFVANPSIPDLPQSDNNAFNGMMNGITSSVEKIAKDAISIGWGYYVSLLGAVACFFFNSKK